MTELNLTTPTTFPRFIDSTMRGSFVACPQHFFRSYRQHLRPKSGSPDLVAGGAFAKGLEVARLAYYAHGVPEQEAIIRGIRALTVAYGPEDLLDKKGNPHIKSWHRMAGALQYYFEQWPMSTDILQPHMPEPNLPAVEFSFANPIPGTVHPDTGEPIIYCGRFDMVGEMNKTLFIVDEKTTGQLGPSWPDQWQLRSQFTGYCWAAREFGLPVAGAIIRGIAIYKNDYAKLPVVTYRPQWQIKRWLEQLRRDIERMIRCYKDGYWDYALDSACSHYGGCGFRKVCQAQHPDPWIPQDFDQNEWKPLKVSGH